MILLGDGKREGFIGLFEFGWCLFEAWAVEAFMLGGALGEVSSPSSCYEQGQCWIQNMA